MRVTLASVAAIVLLWLAVPPTSARAAPPVIDGTRDAAYGAALATQATQTDLNDTLATAGGSDGYELDEAFGFISNDVLYLMLTGNMFLQPNNIEPGTESSPIDLFIDSRSGGQNTLRSDNDAASQLGRLAGLTFDSDFVPDYWLGCYGTGGPDFSTPYELQTYYAALPTSAGATATYLGEVTVGGQSALSGGDNSVGVALALDNSNAAGVAGGCGAGSGAGATTGFEWAIPLAAIGNPTGAIKVCALIQQWEFGYSISNQVLGPLPAGTCGSQTASSLNFSNVAGNQYFVVTPGTVLVPATSAGLWLVASENPGAALSVTYALPNGGAARFEVIDASGRLVLARDLTDTGPGARTLELARAGEVPAGVYFVRLSQGARRVSARVVILR